MNLKIALTLLITPLFLMGCVDNQYAEEPKNSDEVVSEQPTTNDVDVLTTDNLDEVTQALEDLEAMGIE